MEWGKIQDKNIKTSNFGLILKIWSSKPSKYSGKPHLELIESKLRRNVSNWWSNTAWQQLLMIWQLRLFLDPSRLGQNQSNKWLLTKDTCTSTRCQIFKSTQFGTLFIFHSWRRENGTFLISTINVKDILHLLSLFTLKISSS